MAPQTIFQFGDDVFTLAIGPIGGLAVAVGLWIYVHRIASRSSLGSPRVAFDIFSILALIIGLGSGIGEAFQYHRFQSAMARGEVQSTEGIVSGLFKAEKNGGFYVSNRGFSYYRSSITPAFMGTTTRGVPLRDGERVRVLYLGSSILQIDLL